MSAGKLTITGGSGYVGQLLGRALRERGHEVDIFDRYRGHLVDLVRSRTLPGRLGRDRIVTAPRVRRFQKECEAALVRRRVIRPSGDDILAQREVLATRFKGSRAVIHLAGIPHPFQRGATEPDFVSLNYEGAVNVFEAARDAGVAVFVFASSAQVYKINDPVRVDHLPILETNYLPLPAEGQTTYGFLKGAIERYLAGACTTGSTQAISLRLECPGFLTQGPSNLYISTSVDNLVAGFACALQPPSDIHADVFNIADAQVEPAIADISAYVRARWPYVPSSVAGNECLLSTEKARAVLGYRPTTNGRYLAPEIVW